MTLDAILAAIDEEIAQLQKARKLLDTFNVVQDHAGESAPTRKRRNLSAEARERIAEAQRKRWAKRKAKK